MSETANGIALAEALRQAMTALGSAEAKREDIEAWIRAKYPAIDLASSATLNSTLSSQRKRMRGELAKSNGNSQEGAKESLFTEQAMPLQPTGPLPTRAPVKVEPVKDEPVKIEPLKAMLTDHNQFVVARAIIAGPDKLRQMAREMGGFAALRAALERAEQDEQAEMDRG